MPGGARGSHDPRFREHGFGKKIVVPTHVLEPAGVGYGGQQVGHELGKQVRCEGDATRVSYDGDPAQSRETAAHNVRLQDGQARIVEERFQIVLGKVVLAADQAGF